jgi:hypothetical protein
MNTQLPTAKDVLLVNADFLPLVDPTDVHAIDQYIHINLGSQTIRD